MPIPERSEYETLIYDLPNRFPWIATSTLHIYSTSASAGVLEGEIILKNGIRIQAVEVLDFRSGIIRKYSYTIYRGETKIRWYDPQPHPENEELAATFKTASLQMESLSMRPTCPHSLRHVCV